MKTDYGMFLRKYESQGHDWDSLHTVWELADTDIYEVTSGPDVYELIDDFVQKGSKSRSLMVLHGWAASLRENEEPGEQQRPSQDPERIRVRMVIELAEGICSYGMQRIGCEFEEIDEMPLGAVQELIDERLDYYSQMAWG